MENRKSLFQSVGMHCITCKPIMEKQLKDEEKSRKIGFLWSHYSYSMLIVTIIIIRLFDTRVAADRSFVVLQLRVAF